MPGRALPGTRLENCGPCPSARTVVLTPAVRSAVWRLGDADDADDFDCTWNEIYDLADFDRVWIDTHR